MRKLYSRILKVNYTQVISKLRRGPFKPTNPTEIIEDNDCYFTIDSTDNYSNDSYFSHYASERPEVVKYEFKQKFNKKVLVWIAISPRGTVANRPGMTGTIPERASLSRVPAKK